MDEDKRDVNEQGQDTPPEQQEVENPAADPAIEPETPEQAPDLAGLVRENEELRQSIGELLTSVRELIDSGLRFGDVQYEKREPTRSEDDKLLDSIFTD